MQGYKDKMDESLGMRRGKESTKSQSYKARRDESIAMEKRYKSMNLQDNSQATPGKKIDVYKLLKQ